MYTFVRGVEEVCRERAKTMVREKYGDVMDMMAEHGRACLEGGASITTDVRYKYQKIREAITGYENTMYLYYLKKYEQADDQLAEPRGSDLFDRQKSSYNLKDRMSVIKSNDAIGVSNHESKRMTSIEKAIDTLRQEIK
jgi:hypothetical protein